MARASVYTLLPIDSWAAILGISPWEFNSMVYPAPQSTQCKDVIQQYQWQSDHLSREEIAQAIADAEQMIADELLYWPAPYYKVGEVAQYPRPRQRNWYGYGGNVRGEWKTVNLKWQKVISGGVINRTLIGNIPAGSIVKSDLDGDGVFETFTATLVNAAFASITDTSEVAIYFTAPDRHGEPIGETWRLRPVRVSISGNTATIVGHRTLLVKPSPEFGVDPDELDPAVDANYVTSLDCYRTFTDTSATAALPYQGVAMWKNVPDCTQDCTFSIKELCLGQDDNEDGVVFASYGSPSTWPFSYRDPDRLQVNYVSGLPLENGQMNPEMARIITYLSVSLLANDKCGCDRSNRILAKWRKPITRFEDNTSESGAVAYQESSNAFPMTVGGQYAWQRTRKLRHLEAIGL